MSRVQQSITNKVILFTRLGLILVFVVTKCYCFSFGAVCLRFWICADLYLYNGPAMFGKDHTNNLHAAKIKCLSWPSLRYHCVALFQFWCNMSQSLIIPDRHPHNMPAKLEKRSVKYFQFTVRSKTAFFLNHYVALLQFCSSQSQNLIFSSL